MSIHSFVHSSIHSEVLGMEHRYREDIYSQSLWSALLARLKP